MIFTAQRIGTQGFWKLQTLIISICLPNNPWVIFMEFSGTFWLLVEWYVVTKWGLDKLNSICKDQQMREWLGILAQDCFDWCFNGNGTPPQEAISQWWGKPFLVSDSTLLSHLGVPCGRSDTTTGMNYYMMYYLMLITTWWCCFNAWLSFWPGIAFGGVPLRVDSKLTGRTFPYSDSGHS